MKCEFCQVNEATIKDYREIDECLGSYCVCELCIHLEDHEVIDLLDKKVNYFDLLDEIDIDPKFLEQKGLVYKKLTD